MSITYILMFIIIASDITLYKMLYVISISFVDTYFTTKILIILDRNHFFININVDIIFTN